MLAPFMLPEALVIACVVFPVCLHVRQKVCLAERLEDASDTSVFSVLESETNTKGTIFKAPAAYRAESQFASKVPSQWSGHSPCTVQEVAGPRGQSVRARGKCNY